jgi:hypothetical protein
VQPLVNLPRYLTDRVPFGVRVQFFSLNFLAGTVAIIVKVFEITYQNLLRNCFDYATN